MNQIEVYYAKALPHSFGSVKVTVELLCDGQFKEFTGYVNFMPNYDFAMTLDGDQRYQFLFNLIESQISDEIKEWISQIN
jgi:hypothetical protein